MRKYTCPACITTTNEFNELFDLPEYTGAIQDIEPGDPEISPDERIVCRFCGFDNDFAAADDYVAFFC